MANNQRNNGNQTSTNQYDVSQNTSSLDMARIMLELSKNMSQLNRNISKMSQSNGRDTYLDDRDTRRNTFRDRYKEGSSTPFNRRTMGKNKKEPMGGFLDELENSLLEGVMGFDFKKEMNSTMQEFAKNLGVQVSDVPGQIGKLLGNKALSYVKSTSSGKRLVEATQTVSRYTVDAIKNKAGSLIGKLVGSSGTATSAAGSAASAAGTAATAGQAANVAATASQAANAAQLATVAKGASTALGQVGTAASAGAMSMSQAVAVLGPYAAAIVAGIIIFKKLAKAVKPAIEGFKQFREQLKKTGDRYLISRKENLKLAKTRLADDVKTMIEEPFNILRESAQKVYDVWDNQLRLINGTQGYDKAGLSNLMASFSERIRQENLTSVVSGADITSNLSKVLESGLSGKIAEEFAYQATVLGAAIPTQDFFGFAGTYSSIAANAIRNGKSQDQAIQEANKSLKDFTNNLLFSSRQLAGGFSTGLTNAQNLYEQSVRISQASRTGNTNEISGLLTATSAIIGSIAPDLASSITDAIYKMAVGGNSSDIVALRSLAGVNASNTEFLKELSKNPKKVFTTLFKNLAKMYTESPDAYMEKAEGYAQLFGLSMESFQRIDFSYLADAIASMNTASGSLEENMKHLASGQTTATKEQLRNEQINKYLIDEGLAYVLDNDAARSIQEHMWNEQIARELMEAEYGVELKGSALEFLEGIRQTVQNILNFLNPFAWFKKLANIIGTSQQAAGQEKDIQKLLLAGKVGSGNTKDLYNLTTRNANLKLTPNLLELMGSNSSYYSAKAATDFYNMLANPYLTQKDAFRQGFNYLNSWGANTASGTSSNVKSNYQFGVVKKSTSGLASKFLSNPFAEVLSGVTDIASQVADATSSAQSSVASLIQKMLSKENIDKYVDEHKSYEDWVADVKAKGHISDFSKAITEAGYTDSQLKQYFEGVENEKGMAEQAETKEHEKKFREQGMAFWGKSSFPEQFRDPLFDKVDITNDTLTNILSRQDTYLESWGRFKVQWTAALDKFTKYFIDHQVYNDSYKYPDVDRIKKDEEKEKGDAVYALAEALTANTVDLKDPAIQTNALLSQILLVVNAIMNQNNSSGGGMSLPSTLSALALGLTTSV